MSEAFRRIIRTRRILQELGYAPDDVLGALMELRRIREDIGAALMKARSNAKQSQLSEE